MKRSVLQMIRWMVALMCIMATACNGKEAPRSASKPEEIRTSPVVPVEKPLPGPDETPTEDATPVAVEPETPEPPAKPETVDRSTPPDARQEEILATITGEKLKPTKEHYYTSNETRYDLWYPYIENLGGAYMGVGPDQNYSLAAVADPELVILMDYDAEVLALHRMYLVLVAACENPQCVLDYLSTKKTAEVLELARAKYSENIAQSVRAVQRGAGSHILKNQRARIRQKPDEGGRFWLTDDTLYKRWRTLVLANRIRVFPGDLTRAETMNQISAALKQLNIPLRVLYFSNAEEFWHYPKPFREAIINMPFDEKSMVLRSVVLGDEFRIGWKFHYTLQKATDFVEWMKVPGHFTIKHIVRKIREPIDNTKYFSRIPAPPPGVKLP